jgi:response regulator RpfG family c-di-GMP phosphodiesterase
MTSAARRLRVVVLDDEATARELMRRYLGLHGYDVVEAATVAEAVQALGERPVDAVILDVRLAEEQTGLDVLQSLRRQKGLEKVPVIILTGAVLSDEEELLITRQRAFLFRKPESLDLLLNFLDQMTGTDQPQ